MMGQGLGFRVEMLRGLGFSGYTRCRIEVKVGRCRKFLKVLTWFQLRIEGGMEIIWEMRNLRVVVHGLSQNHGSEIPRSELAPSSRTCRSILQWKSTQTSLGMGMQSLGMRWWEYLVLCDHNCLGVLFKVLRNGEGRQWEKR